MAQKVQGTEDLFGGYMRAWQHMLDVARDLFGTYGFDQMETPAIEQVDTFVHGIGESTDVVRKEMFRVFSGALLPDVLERGAVAGHMFETFAVGEVLKSHMNAGASLRDIWFYRDAKKREIDLVVQRGRTLHPVEVKTAATVGSDAVKSFSCLEGMPDYEVGFGHVLCQAEAPYFVSDNVQAVPVWAV